MNITVVGAGATGGYFGARLAESGFNVTFLVREKRAAQLRTTGLVVRSAIGDIEIKEPQIALDPQDIAQCDLVLLAVKNYQLQECLPQLKVLADRGAKILPFLNGIEHIEILRQALGEESVLGGVCKIVVTLNGEGTIQHSGKLHSFLFGELEPSSKDFCLQLESALKICSFKGIYSEGIYSEMWSKYAFITVFSGVTTAGDLTTDQIYHNEATRNVYSRALTEMKNLAGSFGSALPDHFVPQNVEGLAKFVKGSTSSMHQDLRKGLPLEVESLQGSALRLASSKNLQVPIIETLYGLIKPREQCSNP